MPDLWTAFGIVLALVALAATMITIPNLNTWEPRIARVCFVAATLVFLGKLIEFGVVSDSRIKLVLVGAGGAVAAIGLTICLGWVTERTRPLPPAITPSAPPQSSSTSKPLVVAPAQIDPMEPSEAGKVFANRPLSYFMNILAVENGLQAKAIIQPYFGTLVSFAGIIQINNINEASGLFISVGIAVDGGFVICRFSTQFRDLLARIQPSEKMEITGTLSEIVGSVPVFTACHQKQ